MESVILEITFKQNARLDGAQDQQKAWKVATTRDDSIVLFVHVLKRLRRMKSLRVCKARYFLMQTFQYIRLDLILGSC